MTAQTAVEEIWSKLWPHLAETFQPSSSLPKNPPHPVAYNCTNKQVRKANMSTQQRNQEVIFASKPEGKPSKDNFKFQDCPCPKLSADGDVRSCGQSSLAC